MRLLVLGGSVFLSRAVAEEAVRRGHDVTCANRGTSGAVPEGATYVRFDRADPVPDELASLEFDAVVDVGRYPSWVRNAVAAFPKSHWVFVSTINVYSDDSTPGGRPGVLPLRDPIPDDVDLAQDGEAYGPMKVACEQIVAAGVESCAVVRPGLIVGPGDPTGRFTYWPGRMARVPETPEVLAPGAPSDVVQVIDVRDLAAWLLHLAEQRREGTYDGVGPALGLAELLQEVAAGCGVEPQWTWVDQEFLKAHDIEPWMGPRSIPLWLPRPEYDGIVSHDVIPSLEAGLEIRPIADTARDTLLWLQAHPEAVVTGLTPAEEAEVLEAWGGR